MNLSSTEKKILKKIAQSHLITKVELKNFVKQNEGKDPSAVDIAARALLDKKLINEINPIGSTCFIITQKGTRFLSDNE